MNSYTDFGSMQRAAERRVYEMQRRAAGALSGGQQQMSVKPNGSTDTQPHGEPTKRRNCSESATAQPFGRDCGGQSDPPQSPVHAECSCTEQASHSGCADVSNNTPCQSGKGKLGGLLGGIGSPDKLLKEIPDEYLLLLVLVMLIREQCDLRLIIAIAYILL